MVRHVLVIILAAREFDPNAVPVTVSIDILAVLLLLTAVVALALLWVLRRQRHRIKLGEQRLREQSREIDEARQAGHRARVTEQNLRDITQRVPLVVFVIRRDGRRHRLAFRAGNLQALFGLDWGDMLEDGDELRDWPFQDRIHPEDRLRLRQLMRRAARYTQTTFTLDFRAYGEAGLRWIHLLAVARHPPGEDAHWIGYFIDTTSINTDNASLRAARNAAERASRAKADFLATMSHEIRTPMNGVIGMLELLEHTSLDAEQRELLGAVEDSASVLLRVLNDVLDFSKLEAGELRLDLAPFDPRVLVDNVVGMAAAPMQRKGLRIVVEADASLAGRLLGDGLRLRQILLNLLGNAGKFTDRGSVTVAVRVIGDDGRSQRLHLSVSDTGIGIPAERQAGLFQPFSQAEASTARHYGGTGLGLSICRNLVELMGGKIDLDSEPGHGTTVAVKLRLPIAQREIDRPEALVGRHAIVRLRVPAMVTALCAHLEALGLTAEAVEPATPLREGMAADLLFVDAGDHDDAAGIAAHVIALDDGPDAPTSPRVRGERIVLGANPLKWQALVRACMLALAPSTTTVGGEAAADAAPARHGCILVAEDHPVNRTLVQRQLALLGWTCEVVGDGKAALEVLRENDYDLLLTDCRMPVMDGYELARAWREHEAGRSPDQHLPIIAMTAHASENEIARCREAGMDDCLGKPVRLQPLEEKIAAWLPAMDLPTQGIVESGTSAQRLHGDVLRLLLETSHADLEALEYAVEAGDVTVASGRLHRLLGAWQIFSDDAALADGQRLLDALEGPRAADALRELPAFVNGVRQLMDDIAMPSVD